MNLLRPIITPGFHPNRHASLVQSPSHTDGLWYRARFASHISLESGLNLLSLFPFALTFALALTLLGELASQDL